MFEQFRDDLDAVLDGLAWPIHRLRHALSERAVMIDECAVDIGKREPSETLHCIVRGGRPCLNTLDQFTERTFVHQRHRARRNPQRHVG